MHLNPGSALTQFLQLLEGISADAEQPKPQHLKEAESQLYLCTMQKSVCLYREQYVFSEKDQFLHVCLLQVAHSGAVNFREFG